MKELELTLRVRNNRLKERREELGMTQREIALAVGVSHTVYRELEAMRRSPMAHGGGHWIDGALRLARFHCVEPEELFPPAVLGTKAPVAVRKMDGADIGHILSGHQRRQLEGPEAEYDRAELREKLNGVVAKLRKRDAEVLRMRFGLIDGVERTLEEVSAALGVTSERARHRDAGAETHAAPAAGRVPPRILP